MKVKLYTDGGVRTGRVGGSKGRGSAGFVILDEDDVLIRRGGLLLDEVTVNEAEYCNPPEAPVMMGNFSYKPIGDIQVGDLVIGWDRPEGGKYRRLVRSEVIATQKRIAPLVNVYLASGAAVRCTPDHRWGMAESKRGSSPMVFLEPKVGRKMKRIFADVPALDPSLAHCAGYLGGLYDGEGCRRHIAQWVEANPIVFNAIGRALDTLGLPYTSKQNKKGSSSGYYLTGGRDEFLKFVMWCKPQKIVADDSYWIPNTLLPATTSNDEIVAIEDVGTGEVVALQTTTGNYTAWGYASKNCGVILGLYNARMLGATEVDVYSDSMLIVTQINKLAECRMAHLQEYLTMVREEIEHFDHVQFEWIPREDNKEADYETRKVLDAE